MSWVEIKKAVNSNLKMPLNEGGVKIVKSIQRFSGNGSSSITFGSPKPNVEKCLFLLQVGNAEAHNIYSSGSVRYVSSEAVGGGGYVGNITSSGCFVFADATLYRVSNNISYPDWETRTVSPSWVLQVVEFY